MRAAKGSRWASVRLDAERGPIRTVAMKSGLLSGEVGGDRGQGGAGVLEGVPSLRDVLGLRTHQSVGRTSPTTRARQHPLHGSGQPHPFDFSVEEATTGFEPVIAVLQTAALPLGYVAGTRRF